MPSEKLCFLRFTTGTCEASCSGETFFNLVLISAIIAIINRLQIPTQPFRIMHVVLGIQLALLAAGLVSLLSAWIAARYRDYKGAATRAWLAAMLCFASFAWWLGNVIH